MINFPKLVVPLLGSNIQGGLRSPSPLITLLNETKSKLYIILGLASGCHIATTALEAKFWPELLLIYLSFPHTFQLKQRKQCNAIYYTSFF